LTPLPIMLSKICVATIIFSNYNCSKEAAIHSFFI
jgi:hypothetical protein